MVIPANHRVDAHCNIIHHHNEIISRRTVAALNDKIILFGILKDDIALDHIVNDGGSGQRGAKPDHRIIAFNKVPFPAGSVIFGFSAGSHGMLAHGIEFFRRAGTVIGVPGIQ